MYDELIKSLRVCAVDGSCRTCPRFLICDDEEGSVLEGLFNDAADAIEELSKQIKAVQCVNIGDLECESNQLCTCMGIVRKRLEEAEKKPRWIPVTERLPNKRKWVLCRCQASITDVLRYENAEWYHDPAHVYMFEFVTHWMPIPEPPKEKA